MNIFVYVGIASVLITAMAVAIDKYIDNQIETGVQNAVCQSTLDMQNKAIQQSSIDVGALDTYIKNESQIVKDLNAQYGALNANKCKQKIKGVEHAIDVFYNNPP